MTDRVPDLQEVADDLNRIEHRLGRMEDKLDARFVPRELYEARHNTALRSEIALEVAAIKARQDSDRESISAARHLSLWAVGLIAAVVIAALIGFVTTGVPS